ncbi:MAG: hypothetical protein R6X34_20640 [Chloroflexota bacterium]
MSKSSSRSTADIALIIFFGLLAGLGCLCSFFAVVLTFAEPGEGNYELAPFFLGLTLAGVGSMAMVALRKRYKMGWPLLVVALILWSMGSAVFAFGLTATFMYDEPNDFISNLGYSVGLCIAPGAFLALIGLFVFGFEAWRETEGDVFVSPDEDADEWLKSVKANEKSKLDEDVF